MKRWLQMFNNPDKNKKNKSKKKNKKKLNKTSRTLLNMMARLPKNSKVIVFESFFGKQYSCNPRAIYEELREKYPKYTFYWSIDHRYKDTFKKHGLNTVPRFTLRWFLIMMRAKYWVFNSRLPKWMPKPENTVYLQTWHGTPLKKLALDMDEVYMPGTTTKKYKRNFVAEAKRWNYLVSPNPYSSEIFKRAFKFKRKLLETGYPRNDFLTNYTDEDVEAIRKHINIPEGKKVILYAPTWRDNEYHFIGMYKFALKMDLDKMRDEFGDDYVILLRLHYLISDHLDIKKYEGFAYDVSNYEDIRELYVVSDLLITDYSSVMFDYGILKRPMIFFAYDIDNYRDKLRGFYFDFEHEAPGPIVQNTEEILDEIRHVNTIRMRYKRECSQFEQRFHSLEDGRAAEKVVKKVFKK
ncbi:CDP-glycerol glycerophosphotransferase family protein [Alteribacillus sp. HJP-4]|uniref:CDP-glycerol glycerophosphotransferase family protein n=1 Tax=Alteribacillus sp. HJP-4 TaxID=2775394 RepID=UPI0035CCD9D3